MKEIVKIMINILIKNFLVNLLLFLLKLLNKHFKLKYTILLEFRLLTNKFYIYYLK